MVGILQMNYAFLDISASLANQMSVIPNSVPEKFLRTLRHSHHGQVQSPKFYKLCFHQPEHYEQPSLDVQPDKNFKERNVSSERAGEEVCFWHITFP